MRCHDLIRTSTLDSIEDPIPISKSERNHINHDVMVISALHSITISCFRVLRLIALSGDVVKEGQTDTSSNIHCGKEAFTYS
jgi:hypothetical protein